MGKNENSVRPTSDHVLLRIQFWPFAIVTVALPSVSLAICFITAFCFRFDDVNETMCEVQNFIPSISAVTGITPQTYLWRIGIALHIAPRFAVTLIHYNYYMQRLCFVDKCRQGLFKRLVSLNFCLNAIENSALVGVTYVSNKENYPVHEKLFIMYMVNALCYMLCNNICYKMSRDTTMTKDEERSYFWKRALFVSTMASTAGLLYFFFRHRVFCEPGAFSYFSLCEYVIAYSCMGYHFTAYNEFKGNEWLVASCVADHPKSSGNVDNNNVHLRASESTADDTIIRRRKQ